MGEIVFVPDLDSWLVLGESGEINILMVVHDIGMFVAIKICTFWCLSPHKVKFQHPLVSSDEGNWFEDMVTLCYLGFLHEINDCLGGNMLPDIGDVNL